MCGICGLYCSVPQNYLDESVRHMVRTIGHRGPVAQGTFVGDGAALRHWRRSIISANATKREFDRA
jgi:asparagine synthetase B (glutamine-hydrolysing)